MSLEKKIQLRPGEHVVLVVRRAGIIFAWRYLIGLSLWLVCAFYLFWLIDQGWWGVALVGVGFTVGAYIILHAWFFWKNNQLIITDERIVDINRLGWFEELISTAAYSDIKDIYLHRKGLFASLLRYATMIIESKSQRVLLELPAIAEPEKILALVLDQNDAYHTKLELGNKQAIYKSFIKIISDLSEAELCEILDLVDTRLADLSQPATAERAVEVEE